MSWSLKLFTVNGIPVRIHVSFLLVIVWAAYMGFSTGRTDWVWRVGFMIAFVLLLFMCVLLHELGHGLVAQLFGGRVADITLWPIGGLARMSHLPERPYQEFVMTAAGPAINILLAILLTGVAVVWFGFDELLPLAFSPGLLRLFLSELNAQTLLILLIFNNALLAVFNLIPAFPLDGGRMLRALLTVIMPYRQATAIASFVGQALALILGIAALLSSNFTLGLIAMFVFFGAWQERTQVRYRASLHGLCVRQAMQPIGVRLYPLQMLGDVAGQVAASSQAVYLVIEGGRLVGLLTRSELLTALRKAGSTARIGQHMRREMPQFHPDEPLADAGDQLWQGRGAAGVVIEAGQVVGALNRGDLARLAEMLDAYPGALSKG